MGTADGLGVLEWALRRVPGDFPMLQQIATMHKAPGDAPRAGLPLLAEAMARTPGDFPFCKAIVALHAGDAAQGVPLVSGPCARHRPRHSPEGSPPPNRDPIRPSPPVL